jgi:hypothetical protein
MIAAHEFIIKFEENKPFIPEDVYEFADKVINICQHLIAKRSVTTIEVKAGLPTDFSDIRNNLNLISEQLSKKIRTKIKITENL